MSKKMIGSFFSGVSVTEMEKAGIKRLSTSKEDYERITRGIKQITPIVEKEIAEVRAWVEESGRATEWFPGCRNM